MSFGEFASAAQIGMPQLATPAAPGTLASTAASGARALASAASFRGLGMAMRFSVEIGLPGTDRLDLGEWSSCEGLRVEFGFERVRSGGEYGTEHLLPQRVTYAPVVLRRAIEARQSSLVQGWLRKVAAQWQEGTGGEYQGTPVTITLHDVYRMPAATWELADAFPVAWSGPSLSARSAEVATETLVLEHGGFLEPAA